MLIIILLASIINYQLTQKEIFNACSTEKGKNCREFVESYKNEEKNDKIRNEKQILLEKKYYP